MSGVQSNCVTGILGFGVRSLRTFGLVALLLISGRTEAQGPPSRFDTDEILSVSEDQLTVLDLQKALLWTGHYDAMVDGQFNRQTQAAIAQWQQRAGFSPTGTLPGPQARILIEQAVFQRRAWQWRVFTTADGRRSFGLPMRLFRGPVASLPDVVRFDGTEPGYGMMLQSLPQRNFDQTYADYAASTQTRVVDYYVKTSDWWVVSGIEGSSAFYVRAEREFSGLALLTIVVPKERRRDLGFLVTAMANSFRATAPQQSPYPSRPFRPPQADDGQGRAAAATDDQRRRDTEAGAARKRIEELERRQREFEQAEAARRELDDLERKAKAGDYNAAVRGAERARQLGDHAKYVEFRILAAGNRPSSDTVAIARDLLEGRGEFPKDSVRARWLLERGVAAGHGPSMVALAELEAQPNGSAQDNARAIALLQRAVAAGEPGARIALDGLHAAIDRASGHGLLVDLQRYVPWAIIAFVIATGVGAIFFGKRGVEEAPQKSMSTDQDDQATSGIRDVAGATSDGAGGRTGNATKAAKFNHEASGPPQEAAPPARQPTDEPAMGNSPSPILKLFYVYLAGFVLIFFATMVINFAQNFGTAQSATALLLGAITKGLEVCLLSSIYWTILIGLNAFARFGSDTSASSDKDFEAKLTTKVENGEISSHDADLLREIRTLKETIFFLHIQVAGYEREAAERPTASKFLLVQTQSELRTAEYRLANLLAKIG